MSKVLKEFAWVDLPQTLTTSEYNTLRSLVINHQLSEPELVASVHGDNGQKIGQEDIHSLLHMGLIEHHVEKVREIECLRITERGKTVVNALNKITQAFGNLPIPERRRR